MKRITIVGPLPPYLGGISDFNATLVKSLDKRCDLNVISWKRRYPRFLYPGNQINQDQKYKLKQAPFILDSLNPLTWISATIGIKRHRSELIVFHWVNPYLGHVFACLALLTRFINGNKVVFLCHGVQPHERISPIDSILSRFILNFADGFVMHSSEDVERLKKYVKKPDVRIGFIPTGSAQIQGRAIDRTKYTNRILFFGFVRKYKGLQYLIEALPVVLREVNVKLVIAGEFWQEREETAALIKRLRLEDAVELHDRYIPENQVGEFFYNADVVVLPYTSGTSQSAVIKLAYSMNVPVISTRVEGFSAAVEDGATGFLVNANDSEDLARAIIHFYKENKKAEFSENIEKNKDRFSWDKYCELIESFID